MVRWPKTMAKLFKVTSVELGQNREDAEAKLSDRVKDLEENMNFCRSKIRNLPLIQVNIFVFFLKLIKMKM